MEATAQILKRLHNVHDSLPYEPALSSSPLAWFTLRGYP